MEPRLNEAQAGQRTLFFVEAAHFVLAPFLGFLWSWNRLWIQAPAGRQRLNLMAALNAVSHELALVANTTYINALSMCELLNQIAAMKLTTPITLVLDNARYQKCRLVQDLAQSLKIELLYLPPYSPNLNLIERLWKFVKKQCLTCRYYENFAPFQQAILACLEQTQTRFKTDLDSLLTLKFQTFQKVQLLTV